jgi:hypothetical protein
MLESYVTAPKAVKRLRSGPSGPYMDGFAAALEREGYSQACVVRYLRAAAHLGYFLEEQGKVLSDMDSTTPLTFFRHLPTCRCRISGRGRKNHHPYFGARRYREYLLQIGVCPPDSVQDAQNSEPLVVTSFRQWLEKHRGASADQTVLSWRCRLNDRTWRRPQLLECEVHPRVLFKTRRPMWWGQRGKADYEPSHLFALSQRSRPVPSRSR